MIINRQLIGKNAEQRALQYLRSQGLQFITQNYCCRAGEIDLIMRDRDDIVFIEVRSRSRNDYGNALETVNYTKQCKLRKAALHYLQKHDCLYKVTSRFDIIAIHLVAGEMQLEWIKNAFTIENEY